MVLALPCPCSCFCSCLFVVQLACSAFFALRDAIAARRADLGLSGVFDLPVPATIDVIQTACSVSASELNLNPTVV